MLAGLINQAESHYQARQHEADRSKVLMDEQYHI